MTVGDARPIELFDAFTRELPANLPARADDIIARGWTFAIFSIPSVLPPIDWGAHNRSFSFYLHAWEAIADLLIAHSQVKDRRYLDVAVTHARSWLETFQRDLLGKDSDDELDALVRPQMPIEWYDMAVGLRTYRLAYMLDVMSREQIFEDDVPLFTEALWFHLKLLKRDHFFRSHSNHGLYQALGQAAAARRFAHWRGMEEHHALALARLKTVLSIQFSEEGPHREHSPGYHYMVMGSVINALRSGLLAQGEFEASAEAIEDAFQWMAKPDSALATFGDTDPRSFFGGPLVANFFRNPGARFVISGGAEGAEPPAGVRAFYGAGYAVARLHRPGVERTFRKASYLAQMAAFHSRVHKHADHLGFIWFDRGRDILIDPGRYAYAGRTEAGSDLFKQGFWYADPRRVYVESTRAHNCVEIDAKSYPRRVRPTGSALRYAGEHNGLAVTECEATHFRSVRHRRMLVMAPGRFLLVIDWLNDRSQERDYKQWLQFAPEWSVEPTADPRVYRASAPSDDRRETLSLVNLMSENALGAPIRGQPEPAMQGWTSDAPFSLVPSTSVAVSADERRTGRFATLLAFSSEIVIDQAATRFNASLRSGVVTWADQDGRNQLRITRDEDGSIGATLLGAP